MHSFLRPNQRKKYWVGINTSGKYLLSMVYALLPSMLIYYVYRKISYGFVLIYIPMVFLCARILFWIDDRSEALQQKLGESTEERNRRLHEILGDKRPYEK
jgi:hypothetical protein